LGTEINRIRKDHRDVALKIALAFPDLYEIGTSHFGLQILYSILNGQENMVAERVYAPGEDLEQHLRDAGASLMSMESHTPLARFDIIGFSLLYELNYTNVLNMLQLSGIPFLSQDRDNRHPLIIAGGPCTCNPEPVADLFDAMVIGDGETVMLEMARAWLHWNDGTSKDREALLCAWSRITGVYIPSFFIPVYTPSGFQTVSAKYPDYKKVSRAVVADLDSAPFPDRPLVPFGRPVHDRLRLEVARGCSRGCRFCQAGMIYRPVRERSPETLFAQAEKSIENTGYENLSLLSLSTGDYTCLIPFLDRLMARCETDRIAVSLPSLRAETLTPHLMETIKRIRKTGFTIAPEAGSQRLRNVINKNITQADIERTVEDAFKLGWRVIKLYFMIGLPTETDDDIEALVGLISELRNRHRKKGKINASVAVFIPKPYTPFQWASQLALSEAKEKIDGIRSRLKVSGIQLKWQNPEMSILEGLWSRGDRRLGKLLINAFERGCRFDGWSDRFRFRHWEEALLETGIDIDFYTTRFRDLSEPLPWDHIDSRVDKTFLKTEWESALNGEHTPDCRYGACCGCGVCDFTQLQPRVYEALEEVVEKKAPASSITAPGYKRVKICYDKKDQAGYFGHLELKNIFFRAIRRAGIPVKYSEGFHPMPRASFENPLPIGMESEEEAFILTVSDTVKPYLLRDRLNAHLPRGLSVHTCYLAGKKLSSQLPVRISYRVELQRGGFDSASLERFHDREQWAVSRKTKKGKTKSIDLKEMIETIYIESPNVLEMSIHSEPGKTLRPAEVIAHIFDLADAVVQSARIIKKIS